MADVVDTYRADIVGIPDIQALGAAYDQAGNSADAAAEKIDETSQVITRAGQTAVQTVNKFDPLTAAQTALGKAQADLTYRSTALNIALSTGQVTPVAVANSMAALTTKVLSAQAALAALTGNTDALSNFAGTTSSAFQDLQNRTLAYTQAIASAQASQLSFNQALGVQPSFRSYADAAADIAAYGAQIDAIRAKFVPLDAAYQTSIKSQQQISDALQTGVLSAQEASSAFTAVTSRYQALAAAADAAAASSRDAAAAQGQSIANSFAGVQPVNVVADPKAYAEQAANLEAAFAAADQLRASLVPLAAAQQASATGQKQINDALAAGIISSDEASDALARVVGRYNDFVTATEQAAQASRDATAAQGQSIANQFAGVQTPNYATDPTNYAAKAADIEAYGKALNSLQAELDPVFAASQAYEAQVEKITNAVNVGAISQQSATAQLNVAKAAFDAETVSAKAQVAAQSSVAAGLYGSAGAANAAKAANGNLGVATAGVTREFVVLGDEALRGNFSRIPGSLIVLAERSNVLGTALNALAPLFTATGLGFVALGAAAVAGLALAAYNTETNNQQLLALQNTLQATRTDYANLAAQAQSVGKSIAVPGLSTSDAVSAASILEATRNYAANDEQLKLLITDSVALSKVMGTDVPAAAKALAAAINDPTQAAQDFANKGFVGFNAQLVAAIKNLSDSGDKAGAFTTFMNALSPSIANVTTRLTPIQAAIADLDSLFKSATGSSQGFAASLGTFLTDQVAKTINDVNELIRSLQSVYNLAQQGVHYLTGGNSADNPAGSAAANNAAFAGLSTVVQGAIVQASQNSGTSVGVLAAIAAIEGGTNPDGSAITNASGHVGAGQFAPSTFAQVQQQHNLTGSISDPTANLTATGFYIQDLVKQFGSLDLAVQAYNAGPGHISSFVHQTPEARTGVPYQLTDETTSYLANFKSLYGGSSVSSGSAPVPVTLTATNGSPVDTSITSGASPYGIVNASAINDAENRANSIGGLTQSKEQNLADQTLLSTALPQVQTNAALASLGGIDGPATQDQLNAAAQTTQVLKLSDALDKLKGNYNNLITPQQQIARSAQDATIPLQAQAGATRDVADIEQKYAEQARTDGKDIDLASQAAAISAKLKELQVDYTDTIAQTALATASQVSINKAFDGGASSVVQATNEQKALTLARKDFIPGEQGSAQATKAYTDALNAGSAAQADFNTLQKSFQQQNDLQTLQLETSTLGENADERTKEIALLQEKQALIKSGASLESAASQQDLENVSRIADATAQLKLQTGSLGELQSFAENTFSTIGNSITQAFATGGAAAINFGSIAQAALASVLQEVLKLSVLNPILNELFGTSNPTLSSVGGVVGTLLGNSSGGSAGGIASLLGLGGAAAASSATSDGSAGAVGTGLLSSGLDFGSAAGSAGSSTGAAASSGLLGTGLTGAGLLSAAGVLGGIATLTSASSSATSQALAVGKIGATLLANTSYGAGLISDATNLLGGALGTSGTATNLALATLGNGVYGPATSGAVAAANTAVISSDAGVASVATDTAVNAAASGAQLSASAATAASSAVSNAIPLLGAAVGVITDLATGNYRGAGFVAGGAALGAGIGSIVPGIGTAIGAGVGAVVGGLVDTFFPQHKENAYSGTEIDVSNGSLAIGPTVSQLTNTSATVAATQEFATNFNGFLSSLNLTITNANGVVANIGQGIKGLTQITSTNQLLPSLQFGSTDTSTNFGIAANDDLAGKQFGTVDQLTSYLQAIASFSDRISAAGIQIAAVGPDLTNIQVGSVAGTSQLSTALNADLPGQTFSNEAALDTEVNKVATFVNETLPSLLNPTLSSATGSVQAGIANINAQYAAAEQQADAYGLSITGLAQAAQTAVSNYLAPSIVALGQSQESITARGYAATGDQEDADLLNKDISDAQEQASYSASITDVYGQAITTTQGYADAMNKLEAVEGEERLQIVQKYATAASTALSDALNTATQSVNSNVVNLSTYVRGLNTSSLSPLSATDQYSQASSAFTAQASLAAGGDNTALAGLSTYADTDLKAAQAVYGSGTQYTQIFDAVIAALGGAASSANTDALTTSALNAGLQSQTATLVASLASLQAEVAGLRAEVKQGSSIPARLAS